MKKRILSVLLAATMLLSLLTMTVFATGTAYAITNGTPESDNAKNHGYIAIDKTTAAEGDTVTVTVNAAKGYQLKCLKYAPTPKTVGEILATVDGFPTSEDGSVPGDAWSTAGGNKCFIYNDSLRFVTPSNDLATVELNRTTEKSGNDYIVPNICTFSITEGILRSITYIGSSDFNGTYQPPACVAAGTMVTMENGEQKAIEKIEIGDVIRTVDHETGKLSSAPVCIVWESKNVANAFTLTFEGGVMVTVIEEHGFYSLKEKKYVFINAKNASDYIGDSFYNADADSWLALSGVELYRGCVDAYAIITSKHLNHLSNGMLSMCDGTVKNVANIFEHDIPLRIDADQKEKDILAYGGLTSLETVLEYKGFNEADYTDYNLQYLNVAIGKGMITWEWFRKLSDYFETIYLSAPLPEPETPPMLLMSAAPKKMLGAASANDDSVEITADKNGKYTFTMLGYAVTVTAEFEEIPHTHAPVKVTGQAATTKEAGFKDYYKCDCGKFFEDAEGKTEITDLAKWKSEGGAGYIAKLESPKTGDNSHMALWVMLLALSSMRLCACLVPGKNRKNVQ